VGNRRRGQSQSNGFEDAIHVLLHFTISEAQNSVSTLAQFHIADAIARALLVKSMLMAIDFDNNSGLSTFEVDDVRLER